MIVWGTYLTKGVRTYHPDDYPFLLSDISPGINDEFCHKIVSNGYALIIMDDLKISEKSIFAEWKHNFSQAFLSKDIQSMKESSFRRTKDSKCSNKLNMGYRSEECGEFIDSRMLANNRMLPYLSIQTYQDSVTILFEHLSRVAMNAIRCLSHYLHIDPKYFLELTDEGDIKDDELSASVLRICKYHSRYNEVYSFGPHTDTTFVTVSPISSYPGKVLTL